MKLTAPQLRVLRLMRTGRLKQSLELPNVYSIMGERVHQRTAASLITAGFIECDARSRSLAMYQLTQLGRQAAKEPQ